MDGRMILGDIVTKVCCPGFPEGAELVLHGPALEPMEAHVHKLEAFAGNIVCANTMCCCVVSLNGRGRLFVAHFFECMADGNGLTVVDEKGSNFVFLS